MATGQHYVRYQLPNLRGVACGLMLAIVCWLSGQVAFAQSTAPAPVAPTPNILPTDVTPTGINQEREIISPGFTFRLFQKLPERLWFNTTTEISNRYESNVFFTQHQQRSDYVFRALPNITVGYNVLKHTSVYTNWFLIKDEFAVHGNKLNFPTTQSLSMGIRQDLYTGRSLNVQGDFQARELWQTAHLHQFDFIPQLIVTYTPHPKPLVLFANVQLQMRGKNYFEAPQREIDPFYTVGGLYQWHKFTFSATNTFVTNFRNPPFKNPIPLHGNVSDIADFEVSHPVVKKIPSLVAFMRAEPIWNWKSGRVPGISGFDFRLYGGLRMAFGKPSFTANIERLREQLLEQENESPTIQAPTNQGPSPTPTPTPTPNPSPPVTSPSTNPEESQEPVPQNIATGDDTSNTIPASVYRAPDTPVKAAGISTPRKSPKVATTVPAPAKHQQVQAHNWQAQVHRTSTPVKHPQVQESVITQHPLRIFEPQSFISDDELIYHDGHSQSAAAIDPGMKLYIRQPQPQPADAAHPDTPVQYIGSALES